MSSSHEAVVDVVVGLGPIGQAVALELRRRGGDVRAVSRHPPDDLPDGIEPRAADARDAAALRDALAGARTVYGCIGLPYDRWADMPPLQTNLIDAAAAAGALLIVMENVYMYGHSQGRPFTEEQPFRPVSRKGEIRARMADELVAAHRAGKVRAASGRASDFYGPGVRMSALGDRVLAKAVAGKRAQVIGDPGLPHTYTYVPDIAAGLATLGAQDEAIGQAWHLPAAETVTTRRIVELIYEAAGHEIKLQTAGRGLLRLAGLFSATTRETVEMLYEFEEPFVVDDAKYTQAFGNHATPLREATAATVAWWQAQEDRA